MGEHRALKTYHNGRGSGRIVNKSELAKGASDPHMLDVFNFSSNAFDIDIALSLVYNVELVAIGVSLGDYLFSCGEGPQRHAFEDLSSISFV